MSRNPAYLIDVRESAKLAIQYTHGKMLQDFLDDQVLQDAVLHRMLLLGEAARRVSQSTRDALPRIPWQDVIGTRNRIVHEYDELAYEIIWDTIQEDLPPLIDAIDAYLRDIGT